MKEISLTKNMVAIIDEDDYPLISPYKWYYHSMGYAVSTVPNSGSKKIMMHRLIMNCPFGAEVDHIDMDKLNNQKSNLRICSSSENKANQPVFKFSDYKFHSKYKGVTWFARDKKWKSQLQYHGRNLHLGYFKDEETAAMAYNLAAINHFGKFANLNVVNF